jgi:molecular chaperone GrpE
LLGDENMSKKSKKIEAENAENTATAQTEETVTQEDTTEQADSTEALDAKDLEIEKLKSEVNSKNEAYLRLAAEYDNFRKRTQSEKLGIYDDATAKTISEILPVADSLDMALQNMQDAPEQFVKGLELVRSQLNASLAKLNIEVFGSVGDEFTPELHNAISQIESEDFGSNVISQVFQRGYKKGGKVIRHAMVQVANC